MFTEQQQNLVTKIILETATAKDFLGVSNSFSYLYYFFLDGDVQDTLVNFGLTIVVKPTNIIVRDNAPDTHYERYYIYSPGSDVIEFIHHRGEYIHKM